MRKFTSFLVLMLLSIAGISAQETYHGRAIESIDGDVLSLDELVDGGTYIFFNTGRNAYIYEKADNTLWQSATCTEGSMGTFVLTLEVTSSSDTEVKANIRTAYGRYLPNTSSTEALSTQTSPAEYTITMIEDGIFHFNMPSGLELNGNGSGTNGDGATVASWYSGDGANGKFRIYAVTLGDLTAQMILDQTITDCTIDVSELAFDIVGGYPQDLIEQYQQAFDDATDAQIMSGDDPDFQQECADNLKAAYDALMNSRIALDASKLPGAGYFYLVNAREGTTANQIAFETLTNPEAVNAAYSDGDKALWDEYDARLAGESADPKFIWQVEAASDTTYTIKNLAFNAYLKNTTAASTAYPLTTNVDDAAKFKFEWASGTTGSADDGFTAIVNVAVTHANNGLHTAISGKSVVNWASTSMADGWYFVPVAEGTIAALQEKIQETQDQKAQDDRNAALSELASSAITARENGKSYVFDGTDDGAFDLVTDEETGESVPDGLITSVSQVYSNAKETAEGSYEGLFDDVFNGNSFFHTAWGNIAEPATEPHFLQIDLGENVESLMLKYAGRSNAQTPDYPYEVVVYGTNDASKLSGVEVTTVNEETGEEETTTSNVPSSEWDNLGTYIFSWNKQMIDSDGNTVTAEGARSSEPIYRGAGLTQINLSNVNATPAEPGYRYIRLSVIKNIQSSVNGGRTFGGYVYWNLSELRGYRATYDPECVYERMDATVKDNLNNAIAKAQEELAQGAATQATIDELQAAYDAFMAVYPDEEKLQELIDEAKSWYDPAEVGDDPGYYPQGAKELFNQYIETAESALQAGLTYDSYQNNMTNLRNGIDNFIASVNFPAPGYYKIQSLTSGAAANAFVYAKSTSTTADANSALYWGYADDSEIDNRANALWELQYTRSGVTLRNVATGFYMTNEQVSLSGRVRQAPDAFDLGLRSARVQGEGAFNVTLYNDSVKYFLNAQPGGQIMVVWNAGQGTDNSAFRFIPTEFQATMVVDLPAPTTIHVFPFPISTPSDVIAYRPIGIKRNKLQLKAIEESEIPAGTPFIVSEDTASVPSFSAYFMAFEPADIVYSYDVKVENGFYATFQPDTLGTENNVRKLKEYNGKYIVFSDLGDELVIATSDAQKQIKPNSGYFVLSEIPETDEDGTLAIALSEDIVSGLEEVTLNNAVVNAKKAGTYNLQGQKINATKNLPKGVYIINGRKVVVK